MKRHQKRSRSMLIWRSSEIVITCAITIALITAMVNNILSSPASPSVEDIYITDADNITADDLIPQIEYRFWAEVEDADNLSDIENMTLMIYLDNENLPDAEENHYTFRWTRGSGFAEIGPGGYADETGIVIDDNLMTNSDARLPSQDKLFKVAGRYWIFYLNDYTSKLVKRTSIDGEAWSSAEDIVTVSGPAAYFDVCLDEDDNFHFVWLEGQHDKYRKGALLENGDINWLANTQIITTGVGMFGDPIIRVDSNSYPWIGYIADNYVAPQVTKSDNKDGTWQTSSGFPYQLEDGDFIPKYRCAIPIPLSNGQVYIVYGVWNTSIYDNLHGQLWNGSSWEDEENVSTSYPFRNYSMWGASAIDNNVHVAMFTSDYRIVHIKRTWGVGWGNEENIQTGFDAGSYSSPTLILDNDRKELWAFWANNNQIYYKRNIEGVWDDDATSWIDETTDKFYMDLGRTMCSAHEVYDNEVLTYYVTETNDTTPYQLKFAYINLGGQVHLVVENCVAGDDAEIRDNYIFAIKFSEYAQLTDSDNWDMWVQTYDNAGNQDNEFFLNQFDIGSAPNVHPNPPTFLLCEGQTNPTYITDFTPELSAVFTDNDAGDNAENMEIWVGTSSGDNDMWASEWIDVTTIENNARSEDISYGGSALTSGVTYYWRCRFMDENEGTGAWSVEVATFRINRPPNPPTSLLCEEQTNPTFITDLTPEFSAIGTDNDGDQMNHYALQIDDDSEFGSPIWNRTKTSITVFDNGMRCEDITYAGSTLSRGTTYYWRIKFWDDGSDDEYWSTETATFKINQLPTTPENWTDLGTDVTDFTPTIEWSKGTDGDEDTVETHVYVGTESAPTEYETSTVDNTCELGNTITLNEDGVYFYRLRSWDGLEWSSYTSSSQFRMTGGEEPPYPSVPDITVENNGERLLMIHPIADAPVSQLFPDQNYGHQSLSYVQYNPDEPMTVWTYVKYSVPENILRQDKFEIYDIRLSLTVHGPHATPEIHIYETSSDWSESTITWNNKPDLGRFVVNTSASWDESFDNYDRIFASLNDYTFTAGEVSFVIVPNENIPINKTYYLTFMMREAGQFGTIEFAYMRIHVIPASLVSIALLCTLAFAGFGVYKKMGEIHDMDSLIKGWEFLLYLSILVMTAVVLAWSFIG